MTEGPIAPVSVQATTPAPSADEHLVRLAIRARGDAAAIGSVVHGVLAAIAIVLMLMGGEVLPFSLGAAGLGTVAIWLGVMARRRRDGRSAPLRALLHEPAKVEAIRIEDEEAGLQVQITVAGVTDHVCPPGRLDELTAMLQRRCPQAPIVDRRR